MTEQPDEREMNSKPVEQAIKTPVVLPVNEIAPGAHSHWSKVGRHVYPVVGLLLLLGIWEFVVVAAEIGAWLLPRPSDVILACFTQAFMLLPAAWITFLQIVAGFALSIVIGVSLAMAIVASRPIEQGAYPLLVATQVIPKIAIAPILTIWFGYGMAPKIMMAFLISFFPIVIDSIVGLKSVSVGKLQLAQTMGASRWQIFTKIRFPNALPSILGGVKIASTFAVVGAVVGEFISADRGLGRVILIANGDFDTVLVFASIVYLTVIGFALFHAVGVVERLLIPWHVSQRVGHMTGKGV